MTLIFKSFNTFKDKTTRIGSTRGQMIFDAIEPSAQDEEISDEGPVDKTRGLMRRPERQRATVASPATGPSPGRRPPQARSEAHSLALSPVFTKSTLLLRQCSLNFRM